MLISVVIRTQREQVSQATSGRNKKTRVTCGLGSRNCGDRFGSTDDTVKIAQEFGCRLTSVYKKCTFGRTNKWVSDGDVIVMVSGHCVPVDDNWIRNLVSPLVASKASMSMEAAPCQGLKFSEARFFERFFPGRSDLSKEFAWANNANSALLRSIG